MNLLEGFAEGNPLFVGEIAAESVLTFDVGVDNESKVFNLLSMVALGRNDGWNNLSN